MGQGVFNGDPLTQLGSPGCRELELSQFAEEGFIGMDADTAPMRTAGAAFLQGTGGTDLRWEMHGPAWLKRHLLLVRTADALPLPIKLKGGLEKARAIAHRPGFAVDHQIRRPLAHQCAD